MNGAQFHSSSTQASAAPGEDRDDRRGEGERPEDLVERSGSAARAIAGGQLSVVGQAQRDAPAAATPPATDPIAPTPTVAGAPRLDATARRSGIEA